MSLLNDLIQSKHLKTPRIIQAFQKVGRDNFLTVDEKIHADNNMPVPIGYGQTNSQPLTVALMIELLDPRPGDKILDVGSGSGWTTALLTELAGDDGLVFGVEVIPELKNFGEDNFNRFFGDRKTNTEFFCQNGYYGLPERAPFDKILVSAAAISIPEALLDQLKIGGRLVMPVGQWFETQEIIMIEKTGDHEFNEEKYPGFVFVPLVKNSTNNKDQ